MLNDSWHFIERCVKYEKFDIFTYSSDACYECAVSTYSRGIRK